MNMEKTSKKLRLKVYSLASAPIFVSILIINLFFYGLSHSEEPIAGYITTVKVRMESSTKRQSIEKVIIQSGIYKGKPPKPYDITTSLSPSGLPQLVLLDPQGRVLYMMEFEYPKLMTVPPLPPGEKDDAPSVVPIENPEVTLVLPYFPDALTIQVIPPGETRPSDSMPLSDAEFIKKNKSDAVPIEPAPSLPGSFNILIMASGYDPLNMTNFQTRADSLMQTLQSTEPFKSYASKISTNIYGNTADLGCYTGCYNIDRLMCCDSSKVISAAASSGYYYDEIIVIHNTATYAGGGYRMNTYKTNSYSTYCMIYDGPYATPMGLHEFGHSFGNLCDEYTYGSEGYKYDDCVNCRANCTDWSLYSSSCQSSCDAMQTYYRPEDSVMLSLSFMTYNNPSIKALYSPDGLEKRIQYFTGTLMNVFSDVPSGYWAEDYIIAIYNAGITTGYGDGRYGPEDPVTRDQMAAFIVRAVEGEPPLNYCDSGTSFPDVTPDMWSCRYIKRLKELRITTGYQDGTYGPYDYVPREQMAAFLVRAVEGEPPANYCDSGTAFPDVTPTMWSCKYIKRLKELNITTGYSDGTYGPYDLVTRAQMAAFLSRAFLGMQ